MASAPFPVPWVLFQPSLVPSNSPASGSAQQVHDLQHRASYQGVSTSNKRYRFSSFIPILANVSRMSIAAAFWVRVSVRFILGLRKSVPSGTAANGFSRSRSPAVAFISQPLGFFSPIHCLLVPKHLDHHRNRWSRNPHVFKGCVSCKMHQVCPKRFCCHTSV